eukprot:IDg3754t1
MAATPEECSLWQSAIDDEFGSLNSKSTWQRDDNPGAQPLPTHVILKVKRKSDGSVERFKARVVAGGNFQTYGENYMGTYAPVVSFTLVRIFLYLVVCSNMYVAQLDVKTAFLNGDLADKVWVRSPRGIPGRESLCYRLRKAMYGLKQAHLAWHTKLSGDLYCLRFEELCNAPCVFRRKSNSSGYVFILVYVDDLLVLAPTLSEKDAIVQEQKELYDLRVAEQVDQFLGVQLGWKFNSAGRPVALKLSQQLYTESILRSTGRTLPADYWVAVVLGVKNRLDILAPVLILARFQKMPTAYCHRGAKRVLRYLRGTHSYALTYLTGSIAIQAYVDADYAGDTVDRKSMSGFMVKLGDAVCLWGSKKQSTVALSTCESEYYAMTLAAKETVWVRRVLMESGMYKHWNVPVPLRSDNQSAITWATGERCPSGRA